MKGDDEDSSPTSNEPSQEEPFRDGDDDPRQHHGTTNVLILTDSGKPLFARYGNDEQVSHLCGVLQGLRAFCLYDNTTSTDDFAAPMGGDVQSVETDRLRMILWTVQTWIFVAVTESSAITTVPTEAYLRFVLETLYCELVLILTQPVLDSLMRHPHHADVVSSVMGTSSSTERQLHALLDQMDALDNNKNRDANSALPSPLGLVHALGGALQPLHPMSPLQRDQASRALRDVDVPDTLFGVLFVSAPDGVGRLVSLVQSAHRPLQMRATDWSLVLHFLVRQQHVTTTEEGQCLPLCLPRFNASGYVYCYTCCLDATVGLCLGLVSHIGTTEQLRALQQAVGPLCAKLSIPSPHGGSPTTASQPNNGAVSSDQDYVDAAGDGDAMIPYVAADGLVEEVARALEASSSSSSSQSSSLHAEYLQVCQSVHFCFRYDVALPRPRRGKPGRLPQCLCVCHPEHFASSASRQRLWSVYDKLLMRLRLGSAQSESVQDALQMIAQNDNRNDNHNNNNNGDRWSTEVPVHAVVDRACHALVLLEAAPDFAGMTAVRQGDYLYVGINGEAFELYFTVSNRVSVKQATALGAKLVRRLLMDQQKLFLCNPLVWKK